MISQDFLKEEVIQAFGSNKLVAEFFGIDRSAVSLWKNGAPIPELRQVQIQLNRPDLVSLGRKRRKNG